MYELDEEEQKKYKKRIENKVKVFEIRKKREKRKIKKDKKDKRKKRLKRNMSIIMSIIVGLSSVTGAVYAIDPVLFSPLIETAIQIYHDWVSKDDDSGSVQNGDDTINTEPPTGDYVVEINADDFWNGYEFEFSNPKKLDDILYGNIEDEVKRLLKNKLPSGKCDDIPYMAEVEYLENKLNNASDLSLKEVIESFDKLISMRKDITEALDDASSYFSLAQAEQNYAGELQARSDNDDSIDKTDDYINLSKESIHKFMKCLCYEDRKDQQGKELSVGDILYRSALSFDKIARSSKNNINDKMRACFLANGFYKLSLSYKDDKTHGVEAYYQIGNNYELLYLLINENRTMPGADQQLYYADKAYENYKQYFNIKSTRKVKESLYNICKILYNIHKENNNYNKEIYYINEMRAYE